MRSLLLLIAQQGNHKKTIIITYSNYQRISPLFCVLNEMAEEERNIRMSEEHTVMRGMANSKYIHTSLVRFLLSFN
jgi:hypothetical protein